MKRQRMMRRGCGLPLEGKEPFLSAAQTLLDESGCEIKSYRSADTGVALTRSPEWWIIVPRPTTPERFGVFAHEVGHQVLHRFNSKPRWLEEVEAWDYAEAQVERFGLPPMREAYVSSCIDYALAKALRRGASREFVGLPERYRHLVTEPRAHVKHVLWQKDEDQSLRARAKRVGL